MLCNAMSRSLDQDQPCGAAGNDRPSVELEDGGARDTNVELFAIAVILVGGSILVGAKNLRGDNARDTAHSSIELRDRSAQSASITILNVTPRLLS